MNLDEFGGMCGIPATLNGWNGFRRASEIDGKWVAKEMLSLAHIVDEIRNHPGCFDER